MSTAHRAVPAVLALLAVATAAPVRAQQTRVVPRGMDLVEGPSVYTYPFGRADGGMQILCNADQVTLGQGLLTGVRFRQSQVTASQGSIAHSKNYRVTLYTTTTNAASMVADLATNIASAPGTVVFQGPVNLPATAPLAVQPAPFAIHLPFSPPYVFDGSQGNLLLLIETTDTAAVPGLVRIDAVQFRSSATGGLAAEIDVSGCTSGGQGIGLSANAATAVVGGAIDLQATSTQNGAFPVLLVGIALDRPQTDLTPLGMPGCTSWLGTAAFQFILENVGGGYPTVSFALPPNPALEGLAGFCQALGIGSSGQLAQSVTSNGVAVRIGPQGLPNRNNMSAFRSSAGWFIGATGDFVPVVQFEGIFP